MNRLIFFIFRYALIAISILIVAIGIGYYIVSVNANGETYDSTTAIPYTNVGLLLGTSPITPQGGHNYYFDNRILATVDLYRHGKIKRIIASGGDYSGKQKNGCNEPMAMRDSLISYGIPDSLIMLDYQGLRTINSIQNAKEVYNLDSLTIISQKYHNERAIWLAEHYGLHAIAYNAKTPDITNKKIKNVSRELLARVKMFLDIATDKQ